MMTQKAFSKCKKVIDMDDVYDKLDDKKKEKKDLKQ